MRQLPYVLLVALALMIVATKVTAADVPQWTPTDISFKAAAVAVGRRQRPSRPQPDEPEVLAALRPSHDSTCPARHPGAHAGEGLQQAVKWPARGSDEEKLFFRWLVARYAAYPNIIWDFSKEAHNEKDLAYKRGFLQWLRESDPYHHLTTVHDDDKANDSGAYDKLTDFRADQGHNNYHALILRPRARRAWPVANVESDYEHGPKGIDAKTYRGVHTPEETIRCAWEIQMAGGYNAYYYTYTAWDVVRPLDVTPGYAFYKHFGDFWRATQYWKLEPADDLVNTGWCIAQGGHEYVVFQNEAKPFTLEITGAKAPLQAEWFNPHTGKLTAAKALNNGTACEGLLMNVRMVNATFEDSYGNGV